jgi:hypothetical protein
MMQTQEAITDEREQHKLDLRYYKRIAFDDLLDAIKHLHHDNVYYSKKCAEDAYECLKRAFEAEEKLK